MKNVLKQLLLLLVVICFLTGCGTMQGNMYIDAVKNGYPIDYPNTNYEKAFGEFFSSPKWSYLQSDTNKHVVEFRGRCSLLDKEGNILIQFTVEDDGTTFELSYIEFNGESLPMFLAMGLIENAFNGDANESQ